MKKLIAMLMLISGTAFAQFPYHSNTQWFDVASAGSSDFTAFNWLWSGNDDQKIDVNFNTHVTNGMLGFRLSYPKRGNIYLDMTGFVVSNNSNAVIIMSYTNVPPDSTYFAEFMLYNTNSSPYTFRSLAKGKVTCIYSIWEGTNYASSTSSVVAPIWPDYYQIAGDATGVSTNNTVVKIRNRSVTNATPATGDVYIWDGGVWIGTNIIGITNTIVSKTGSATGSMMTAIGTLQSSNDTQQTTLGTLQSSNTTAFSTLGSLQSSNDTQQTTLGTLQSSNGTQQVSINAIDATTNLFVLKAGNVLKDTAQDKTTVDWGNMQLRLNDGGNTIVVDWNLGQLKTYETKVDWTYSALTGGQWYVSDVATAPNAIPQWSQVTNADTILTAGVTALSNQVGVITDSTNNIKATAAATATNVYSTTFPLTTQLGSASTNTTEVFRNYGNLTNRAIPYVYCNVFTNVGPTTNYLGTNGFDFVIDSIQGSCNGTTNAVRIVERTKGGLWGSGWDVYNFITYGTNTCSNGLNITIESTNELGIAGAGNNNGTEYNIRIDGRKP